MIYISGFVVGSGLASVIAGIIGNDFRFVWIGINAIVAGLLLIRERF